MSPKSEHVSRELLAIGFRAYPRGLLNGFACACIAAAFLWQTLPKPFLAGWLVTVAAVNLSRYALSRRFLLHPPGAAELNRWGRYAAVGYACTGLCWGVIGAATLHFAPLPVYPLLVIVFFIAIFSVLQTQTTGAHPMVYSAFLYSAMGPIIVSCAIEETPNYTLRLLMALLLTGILALVGRSGNRYVAESIRMRYENLELLHELTRQKEELNRANNAKTRFLAAASHDLRQPMQAVVLLVESLKERVQEPTLSRIVDNIRSSVVGMSQLLNEILDISKFDAGVVKPQRSSFPIASVLDRLRSSFSYPATQKYLALRVRRSSAVVETDPILLYRILVNLTNNALRYTNEGGVLIGCRHRADGLSIEVWDTGVGIAEDQLAAVFREFYQVGNPQRDREQGLGLGLAIVERTARLLDHPIVVKSRPGRGSMFSVRVPFGDPAAVLVSERARATDALEGCTVLVIEDEREIRAAMTVLLEGWGCNVLSAASAAEIDAVLAKSRTEPDAILADYRLPGVETGIDAIRRVNLRHPLARGILITGDIAPEVLRQAEEAGFQILHKPMRPARLRALLGAFWRERNARAAAA